MSDPLRLTCRTMEEIPPVQEMIGLVTDDQHLVLVFPATRPADFDKKESINRLRQQLPDYSVFDSGGSTQDGSTHITIKKVVSITAIQAHTSELVAAARLFRE